MLALVTAYADVGARNLSVVLSVKPVLCITDRRNQSCEMSFLIAWQSEVEGDYCLYSDLAEAPISCWAEESSGSVAEDRVVDQAFSYWLTNADPGVRLAEATVEVVTTDYDDRRRNRRRRHAWSVL